MVATVALVFPGHPLLAFAAGIVGLSAVLTTASGEPQEWFPASWEFTKLIMPLLFTGLVVAGLLSGCPGSEGLIPSR